jgi:hypothetical protein
VEPTASPKGYLPRGALRNAFDRIWRKWRGQMPWDRTVKGAAAGLGLHQAHTGTAIGNSVCCAPVSGAIVVIAFT